METSETSYAAHEPHDRKEALTIWLKGYFFFFFFLLRKINK